MFWRRKRRKKELEDRLWAQAVAAGRSPARVSAPEPLPEIGVLPDLSDPAPDPRPASSVPTVSAQAPQITLEEQAAAEWEAAEREAAERDAAEREAAEREAAEREAAEREAAEREAAEREAAEREAAEREAAEREAAEREAAEREAAEREVAEREAAEREAAEREAAEREAAEREAAEREVAEREAAERDAAERDAAEREAAEREAAEREAAEVETAPREAAERPAAEQDDSLPQARPPVQTPAAQALLAEERLLEDPLRVFGEIVSMLGKDPAYSRRTLADLAWMVGPAIAAKQALVARARPSGDPAQIGRAKTPVGAILWACVTPEVDEALREAGGGLDALRAIDPDWTGGDRPWIVAVTGSEQIRESMIRHLDEKLGRGRPPIILIP